jgi:hypothetical protein
MGWRMTLARSFLRLIGMSRAIVSMDRVILEIQLNVKAQTKSLHKAVINISAVQWRSLVSALRTVHARES